MTRYVAISWAFGFVATFSATSAFARTLSVGPGKTYATINEAAATADPGDVIEVQGAATYTGTIKFPAARSGTKEQPVTVRGVPVAGKRPILRGVGPGQWDNMVVFLNANHFIMESFEVIGGGGGPNDYCIVNKADDVTLRDLVVHGCPHQGGLVGTDEESGSLTLEYSEFFDNGGGTTSHQIYMATNQVAFPHSVFRMQHCYVHDGKGGNNVKSRAERNEIYYNWIEGATYHELDLIGPIGTPNAARQDSDVVGNVFIKTSEWRIARIGGDGSGNSAGRFRFVNNTMVLGSAATKAISLQETVETLEMYNNVVYRQGGGIKLYDVNEPIGPAAQFFGSNNWVSTGTTNIPGAFTATATGDDPGWRSPSTYDFRPTAGAPIVDTGSTVSAATGASAFPRPLALPAFYPPARRLLGIGSATARTIEGAPDVGAFEANAPDPGAPPSPNGTNPDGSSGGDGSGDAGTSGAGGASSGGPGGAGPDSGCGCRSAPMSDRGGSLALAAIGFAALVRRRVRR